MTYEEALKALDEAIAATWKYFIPIKIHDGIVQVREVFKRMKMDLDAANSIEQPIESNRLSQCHCTNISIKTGKCLDCGEQATWPPVEVME